MGLQDPRQEVWGAGSPLEQQEVWGAAAPQQKQFMDPEPESIVNPEIHRESRNTSRSQTSILNPEIHRESRNPFMDPQNAVPNMFGPYVIFVFGFRWHRTTKTIFQPLRGSVAKVQYSQ